MNELNDVYKLFAIRYARTERKFSECFLDGDAREGSMPIDYFVWAIVNEKRTFVFDTGFDPSMAATRSRTMVRPVGEGLKAIGVDPGAVTDVIISHMHYDHAGNHALFPKARYHLQDTEMAYCTGRCMCHRALRSAFEVGDVTAMVEKIFAGRVAFYDGAAELAPNLTVHKVGGHSKGLQVVRVLTRRGWVVLASDAAHFYATLEQYRPFPVVENVADTLEGYNLMRRLASSADHIVPGHDPLVTDRYPAALAGVRDIVRLDIQSD